VNADPHGPVTDSQQLRMIALYLELIGATDGRKRSDDVQRELRRIATRVDAIQGISDPSAFMTKVRELLYLESNGHKPDGSLIRYEDRRDARQALADMLPKETP